MAKRTVYICDGDQCGAVLVHPEDGFVIVGAVKAIAIEGDPKVLISTPSSSQPDIVTETSLCRECLAKALGLVAR
jgi:hypothetical protein